MRQIKSIISAIADGIATREMKTTQPSSRPFVSAILILDGLRK
jgi:hypothetical protein